MQFLGFNFPSSILPGILFSQIMKPNKKIGRLPIADIPFQIRNADPVLRFQHLLRLHFGDFLVLIGDSSLSVASVMPCIGWAAFKLKIIEVFQLIDDMKIIETIDRYSLKYVNIVAGDLMNPLIFAGTHIGQISWTND